MKNNNNNYKVGQKVHINHIEDDYVSYDGLEGYIEYIDDIGQLHGTWGGCALIPDIDNFYVVEKITNSLLYSLRSSINRSLNEMDNSISAFDFYDLRCTLKINDELYIIEYWLNFINEDYEFDNIKIMHVYKYEQFSDSYDFTKQQHPRKEVYLENIQFYEKYLFDNYYDQIQDGFIKSVFDDNEASNYDYNNDYYDNY